jgi:hypothetical protein
MTTWSARRLIGDALETRHRLPRIWGRVVADELPTWVARRVAQATRGLGRAQVGVVDDRLVEYADGRLPWARFEALLEAAVVAADPEAAAAKERAAAEEEFAKVGQSNQHGQKTLYVRTGAAEMTRIDATIAYLADALKALGDPDPEDRRRSKAVLILANPAQAVRLLQAAQSARGGCSTDGGREGIGGHSGEASSEQEDAPLPLPILDDLEAGPADVADGNGSGESERSEGSEEQADGAADGAVEAFTKPFHPRGVPPCGCRGGSWLPDTADLLPRITLYLHLHADTVTAGNGVARWEGEGPVTASYIRDFLGPYARFTVKPVIDPVGLAPVDAYEVPDRHREALHLRTPADVFPYAPNTGRRKQVDHTEPYRPPPRGGPPGQTGLHNLGPLSTFHHRVKTHAGWQLRQPFPGIYLWRTPHGAVYLVDHTGTRQIRRPEPSPQTAQQAGPDAAAVTRGSGEHSSGAPAKAAVSPLEARLGSLVAAA